MYIGGPPAGGIDTYARQMISRLQTQLIELTKQVDHLQARNDQLEAKLAGTSEALDTMAGRA